MPRIARLAILALLPLALCPGAHAQADACQDQLPQSLVDALARAYRAYRAPLEFDNAPEDIAQSRARGGSGCLGVGVGDFTGAGKKEYLIGLTARHGGGGLAVLAIPRKGGWRWQKLQTWPEGTRALHFVEALPPGHYNGDAAAVLECAKDVVRLGALDGSGSLRCDTGGGWTSVAQAGR